MAEGVTLYTNPMSRGQIARWMLEEVGAAYEEKIVAFGRQMRTRDFMALNPMGKVPVLVHGDQVVTETAAICLYLADAFPDAGLAPAPTERAAYYRWFIFGASPVEQAVTAKAMGWAPEGPEKEGMAGFGSFERTMKTLESHLEAHPYAAGDAFTAADVYLGAQIIWGMQFGTMPESPVLKAYADRLTGRAAYQKARARDHALIAEMKAAEGQG